MFLVLDFIHNDVIEMSLHSDHPIRQPRPTAVAKIRKCKKSKKYPQDSHQTRTFNYEGNLHLVIN